MHCIYLDMQYFSQKPYGKTGPLSMTSTDE